MAIYVEYQVWLHHKVFRSVMVLIHKCDCVQSFKCIARLWFHSAILLHIIDFILLWNIVLMPSVLHVLSLSLVLQFLQISVIKFGLRISLKCMVFCQLKFNIHIRCDMPFIEPMHPNKPDTTYLLDPYSDSDETISGFTCSDHIWVCNKCSEERVNIVMCTCYMPKIHVYIIGGDFVCKGVLALVTMPVWRGIHSLLRMRLLF